MARRVLEVGGGGAPISFWRRDGVNSAAGSDLYERAVILRP